jgi:hypothetical protein
VEGRNLRSRQPEVAETASQENAGGESLENSLRSGMVTNLSLAMAALCLLLPCAVPVAAQMDEYSIKAGFLYNFSKYVEWPEQAFSAPGAPFVICIVGEDPFGGRIDRAVEGKTSGDGHPLQLRRLKNAEAAALRDCHLAFVSKSEKARAGEIIESMKNLSVMTVADFASFAEQGGIADLRIDGTKVKVDLNMASANRANLKVSGKLQQVANLVN